MSRHLVALTVTTLLGVAVGVFVLWKGIQRRRSRTSHGTQQQLAKEFQAPIGSEEGLRLLEDPERRQMRSGARALLSAESLPAQRKEELLRALREFYSTDTVTDEMLQEAASLETRISNESYIPHGLKVVRCHSQGGLRSLMQLESRWRQHFLDSMQPKHLPQQWSVDHNHQKLLRKYGEDLPIKLS
uniref:Exonuclease 3'-5' domain containing 2 n=1 Tax=Molossus molossus TaxID=27622 RepID=A0A7J8JT11_MOLMO|nr:exonuclease 3'-5' domain containing 2 [Molossus molossus]